MLQAAGERLASGIGGEGSSPLKGRKSSSKTVPGIWPLCWFYPISD
jgi:hypothetical protein